MRSVQNTQTTSAELKALLTVDDLEYLLRVDRRTIQRLCKRNELPMPLKLGGSNRWRPEEIAAAIACLGHRVGRKIEGAKQDHD